MFTLAFLSAYNLVIMCKLQMSTLVILILCLITSLSQLFVNSDVLNIFSKCVNLVSNYCELAVRSCFFSFQKLNIADIWRNMFIFECVRISFKIPNNNKRIFFFKHWKVSPDLKIYISKEIMQWTFKRRPKIFSLFNFSLSRFIYLL